MASTRCSHEGAGELNRGTVQVVKVVAGLSEVPRIMDLRDTFAFQSAEFSHRTS